MRHSPMIFVAALAALAVTACGGGEPQPKAAPAAGATSSASASAPALAAPKNEAKALSGAELHLTTVKALTDAMNAHDAKKIASVYTEDAAVVPAGMPTVRGRDAIQVSMQRMFDAFGSFKAARSRVFQKGDVAVVEWAWTGKHSGELHGIKATDKDVGTYAADVLWFSPDGLVREHHVYYDVGTVMNQIGVTKEKGRPVPLLPTAELHFAADDKTESAANEIKNVDLVKTMNAALESKKATDYLGVLADNPEHDDFTQPETSKGKDAAKRFFGAVTKAFPDLKIAAANTWAVGDFVIVESVWKGTHKGDFFGIKPTKKGIDLHGLDVYEVKSGKIVKGWSHGNSTELMGQLGLLPPPKK